MILLDYWLFDRTVLVKAEAALAAFTRAFLTDTIIKPKSENLAALILWNDGSQSSDR